MTGFDLEEVTIPATLGGPEAEDFCGCVDIRDQVEAATVDRLVAAEQQDADGDRTRSVALTVLGVPLETARPVAREDTLVVPGHRGRLGMLLKMANVEHLQRVRPGHPSIITYNAEENRHMLDVNEAIGFISIGREGAWKKTFEPG